MTSDFMSDDIVYPSYRNCHLGNHYMYFVFLSVSPTTRLNYLGSAATADGKLWSLMSLQSNLHQRPPFYNGRLSTTATFFYPG